MSMIYQLEPGLYSDVIFSHTLYFNIDTPADLESFINPKKRAADMRYFRDCLAKFDAPSEELCPFFEIIDKTSFAFTVMYDRMCRTRDFSLDALRRYLPDAQTMMIELYRFYLPGNVIAALPNAKSLTRLIAALPVSALVKFHLLAMTVDPQPYYDALFASLEGRLAQMQAYYKHNRAQIEQTKKSLKQAEVTDFLGKCYGVEAEDIGKDLAYSVMLVGKNAVRYVPGDEPFLIVGYDHPARMAMLIGESVQPDIVKIGKALGEEKRVMILQLLLAEEEITAQQLLRRLELSMTATHYHLEMLMQAGMLLARNEGRTIYYSLNREFFDRAPIVFEKFNSKEDFER